MYLFRDLRSVSFTERHRRKNRSCTVKKTFARRQTIAMVWMYDVRYSKRFSSAHAGKRTVKALPEKYSIWSSAAGGSRKVATSQRNTSTDPPDGFPVPGNKFGGVILNFVFLNFLSGDAQNFLI